MDNRRKGIILITIQSRWNITSYNSIVLVLIQDHKDFFMKIKELIYLWSISISPEKDKQQLMQSYINVQGVHSV